MSGACKTVWICAIDLPAHRRNDRGRKTARGIVRRFLSTPVSPILERPAWFFRRGGSRAFSGKVWTVFRPENAYKQKTRAP